MTALKHHTSMTSSSSSSSAPSSSSTSPPNGLRILYVSDLHINDSDDAEQCMTTENAASITSRKIDVAAIAGDTSSCCQLFTERILRWLSPLVKLVLIVPGNHEHYACEQHNAGRKPEHWPTMDEMEMRLLGSCRKFQNVILLQNTTCVVNDIRFIGTTLWPNPDQTYWNVIDERYNDFRHVRIKDGEERRQLRPWDYQKLSKHCVGFIAKELAIAGGLRQRAVAITHISPLPSGYDGSEDGDPSRASMYHVNMTGYMQPPLVAWIYGHTHRRIDASLITIAGNNQNPPVRILNNPYCVSREFLDFTL